MNENLLAVQEAVDLTWGDRATRPERVRRQLAPPADREGFADALGAYAAKQKANVS